MMTNKKIRYAHKGFFNKESYKQYRENSKELVKAASERKDVDMIELDLRKSSDGVLYCFHGTMWQYHVLLRIPTAFSTLKRRYGVDSLSDILDVVGSDKMIFLDIKDKNVTRDDILREFKGRKFRQVVIGNKSFSLLSRFNGLPEQFVKVMNGNIFCPFYDFEKLAANNYHYVSPVFSFQVNDSLVERARRAGLDVSVSSLFFLSRESYMSKVEKYGLRFVSSDFS